MLRLTIACESCDYVWLVAGHYSLYERQALESRPCPRCGAYTLCCQEPAETSPLSRKRRRRRTPVGVGRAF
jgi:hypothetical protein